MGGRGRHGRGAGSVDAAGVPVSRPGGAKAASARKSRMPEGRAALRQAVVFSEIIGEPVCRKRKRKAYGIKVILVEDESGIRMLLKKIIERRKNSRWWANAIIWRMR